MSVLGAITEHTYTLSHATRETWSTGYLPIKKLPKVLVEYILDFNTRRERGYFHRVSHPFESYSFSSKKRLESGVWSGSIPVDFCFKNALRKIKDKEPKSHVYTFPKNSHMHLRSERWMDVSDVQFNLSEISKKLVVGNILYASRGVDFHGQNDAYNRS